MVLPIAGIAMSVVGAGIAASGSSKAYKAQASVLNKLKTIQLDYMAGQQRAGEAYASQLDQLAGERNRILSSYISSFQAASQPQSNAGEDAVNQAEQGAQGILSTLSHPMSRTQEKFGQRAAQQDASTTNALRSSLSNEVQNQRINEAQQQAQGHLNIGLAGLQNRALQQGQIAALDEAQRQAMLQKNQLIANTDLQKAAAAGDNLKAAGAGLAGVGSILGAFGV